MIGCYGMCVDISRTWLCSEKAPSSETAGNSMIWRWNKSQGNNGIFETGENIPGINT